MSISSSDIFTVTELSKFLKNWDQYNLRIIEEWKNKERPCWPPVPNPAGGCLGVLIEVITVEYLGREITLPPTSFVACLYGLRQANAYKFAGRGWRTMSQRLSYVKHWNPFGISNTSEGVTQSMQS